MATDALALDVRQTSAWRSSGQSLQRDTHRLLQLRMVVGPKRGQGRGRVRNAKRDCLTVVRPGAVTSLHPDLSETARTSASILRCPRVLS